MSEIQGTAASRGYVRAVFSRRVRGHAAPLALVEANLRAVVRSVLAARGDDWRARIRAELADYLVSEPEPEPFTERREHWRKWAERLCFGRTSLRIGRLYLCEGFEDDSIDAPYFMASGSGRWIESDIFGVGFSSQRLHTRDALS